MGTPPLSVLKSNIETLIPKGKYLPSQMVTAALAWSQRLGTLLTSATALAHSKHNGTKVWPWPWPWSQLNPQTARKASPSVAAGRSSQDPI